MNRKIIHASLATSLLAGWMTSTAWADPAVTDIALVSEKRISRTVFEYTYKATITNDSIARKNVQATLSRAGTGTTIIESAINVGELTANQVITPTDTFTIRQDRTYAFNRAALTWSFSGETVEAPGDLGELIISPKVIPPNQDTKVTFLIQIKQPEIFNGGFQLQRLDNESNVKSNLAEMADDGTQGDAVTGDKWYTTQIVLNEVTIGRFLVRVANTVNINGANESIASLLGDILVEEGADPTGSRGAIQGDKLVFRNSDGSIASEINLAPTEQSLSDETGNYLIIGDSQAITTKDQKRAAIFKQSFLIPAEPPPETDASSPYGSSFALRDSASVLWSLSLPADAPTQFYVPDRNGYAGMFSNDGNRILLIKVQEGNGFPKAQIYDATGNLIKEFTPAIEGLHSTWISGNGKNVLLEGFFPASQGGGYGFEAFDLKTDQSITQLLDLGAIGPYFVSENSDGKFEVWSDGAVLYRLP